MRSCFMGHDKSSRAGNLGGLARVLALAMLAFGAASGCGGSQPGDEPASDGPATVAKFALEAKTGTWARLGGDLDPAPAEPASQPSLTFDQQSRPVVAFSVHDSVADTDATAVLGWRGNRWIALGPKLAGGGPSIAADSQDRIAVCLGTTTQAGPFAARWNGSTWAPLGGDVGVETGYKIGRYSWPTCGGIVTDSSDVPIIAWSADVGSKANAVYGARWNRRQQRWQGLDPAIDSRATDASVDIDDQDRVYIASFTPGGSYAGGATTRVWRWGGAGWKQLGADMPNTAGPVIAVRGNAAAFLALSDAAGATIHVKRWRAGAWQDLPSPGGGSNLALDFTPSGRPVLAYADATAPNLIPVKYFADGAWHELGAGIATTAGSSPSLAPTLDLGVDRRGRATVAWTQGDTATGFAVAVARYDVALP